MRFTTCSIANTMIFIDTNILVYAADTHSSLHTICRSYLERLRNGSSPWYVSWPVCYEFLRISTHPRLPRKPWSTAEAWRFLTALTASESSHFLVPTSRHREILAAVIDELPHLKGSIMHDVHTAVLMREHGIREIYTSDTDFHRFPFLRVIDPVK
jgi:toxin-antitoxin system PIN domain toxin